METKIAGTTVPAFSQWTIEKPASPNEAPTSAKTRQAVVLTGMPKAE
jgi:hypothetical protein